jgi:hypothetical protein
LKPTLIAGIFGLILGHVLWLIGITAATSVPTVSVGVLIQSAAIVVLSGAAAFLAWRMYQRQRLTWAAFLGCLPISPIVFTLVVLGVTYL